MALPPLGFSFEARGVECVEGAMAPGEGLGAVHLHDQRRWGLGRGRFRALRLNISNPSEVGFLVNFA